MISIGVPTIAPMSYKALLFCPEQKTYRTVTQILGELDFEIETCNEPFAAVKKLTAEHFDAIVVDCENEQNATLLFKSSRHSSANRASLSIAVVEGQAGVAKAFRIGANLVLTKPINVEQSKGTIRVARGLLRKADAPKSAASLVGASTFASAESSVATAEAGNTTTRDTAGHAFSSLTSPGFSESEFELEKEPEVRPEPTEAALLESMEDPAAEMLRARENQATALKPMASGSDSAGSFGHTLSPSGAGAAAAAAPQESLEEKKSSVASDQSTAPVSGPQSSKRPLLIAAVVLLLAAGAAYVWQKSHVQPKPGATVPTANQPQVAPAAPPASSEPSSTTPAQPSGDSSPAKHSSGSDKSSGTHKPKKTAFHVPPAGLERRLG
jgi:CheY-like chemotaxis protein